MKYKFNPITSQFDLIDGGSSTGAASDITFVPTGSISATNVQDAIAEVSGDIDTHIANTTDAHNASAISIIPNGDISSTDVQTAIVEVRDDTDTKLTLKQNVGNYITALTGDVTASGPGSSTASIANNVITNTMVNSAAAIAFNKLENLSSANILLGNAGNVPTSTAVSGDITISNTGVAVIGATRVTNAMLAGSIDLTTKITGILPLVNGGTGSATKNFVDLTTAQNISGAKVFSSFALTDAVNITTDASLANTFTVTLGGNRTLANPTNPTNGQKCSWLLKQDGTGNRTISFGTAWKFGTDLTFIALSTSAGSVDYIGAIYSGTSSTWNVVAFMRGF